MSSACREIMEGMWRPARFGWIYPLAVMYSQSLTIPNSVTLYHFYGDALLKNSNALAIVDPSSARDVAIILMLIHQMVVGPLLRPLSRPAAVCMLTQWTQLKLDSGENALLHGQFCSVVIMCLGCVAIIFSCSSTRWW